jgi:hypothetical protein
MLVYSATTAPKNPSLHQNTRFEPSTMQIGSVVRAMREPEKIVNKKTKVKHKDTNVIFHVCVGTEPLQVA